MPVLVIVLVIAAAIGLAVKLVDRSAPRCQASVVPAFFPPEVWTKAMSGRNGPSVMILNPASGPGTAPDSGLQGSVREANDAGVKVVGYIGTEYSQRPLSEAEQYVRDYQKWYGVTGIFLDQTPTTGSAQIGYYRSLARFIHGRSPGATIWLNPGAFPDQKYMSVGNVVMVFEGPYSSYLTSRVPEWARHYPPSRFAHTVYATPGEDVTHAVSLSRSRNAGYLFLTDDIGSNPYSALPSYWPREQAAIAGGCKTA